MCPAPGSLSRLALLFERTFVLCIGMNCMRHRTGYWPPAVHERLVVFDGHQLDGHLHRLAGPAAAARLLGVGSGSTGSLGWHQQSAATTRSLGMPVASMTAHAAGMAALGAPTKSASTAVQEQDTPAQRAWRAHRVLALLASLHMAHEARRRGLEVRPWLTEPKCA